MASLENNELKQINCIPQPHGPKALKYYIR